VLRGSLKLEIWDPMDGQIRPIEAAHAKHATGADLTTVSLKLSPATAVFFVEQK
jgi:hypothetical protein